MKLLSFIFLFFTLLLTAQQSNSNVWLFKLKVKDGKYSYTNALNIDQYLGYNNQPVFSNDCKSILYVHIDSTSQADIYKYTIRSKQTLNLTKSTVSEYSPNFSINGNGFSAVVVEKDSVQRLWEFSIEGNLKNCIHDATDSVGYYTWLNSDTLLYYKLTEPHTLRVLNIKSNEDAWICNNPTRAFKKTSNSSKFIYGIKDSSHTEFRIYNPQLRESKLYAIYPSTNEDFIWHPKLGLIKSEKSELLRYNDLNKSWEIMMSFSSIGIKNISRLAIDSKTKQLVIVSNL